jgi:hypothetical protein
MQPIRLLISKKYFTYCRKYSIITDGDKKLYVVLAVGSRFASYLNSDLLHMLELTFGVEYRLSEIESTANDNKVGQFTVSSEDFFYIECKLQFDPACYTFKDENGNVILQ